MPKPHRALWALFLLALALVFGVIDAFKSSPVDSGTVDAIRNSPVDPGQPKGETQ